MWVLLRLPLYQQNYLLPVLQVNWILLRSIRQPKFIICISWHLMVLTENVSSKWGVWGPAAGSENCWNIGAFWGRRNQATWFGPPSTRGPVWVFSHSCSSSVNKVAFPKMLISPANQMTNSEILKKWRTSTMGQWNWQTRKPIAVVDRSNFCQHWVGLLLRIYQVYWGQKGLQFRKAEEYEVSR